jgi:hypothetical protein
MRDKFEDLDKDPQGKVAGQKGNLKKMFLMQKKVKPIGGDQLKSALCKEILLNCEVVKARTIGYWEKIVYKLKRGEQKIPIQGILKLTKVFIYHTNNFKLMTRATNIFNILKPEISDLFELATEEQQYMQLLELKYTNILRKKGEVDPQISEASPMKDDWDNFENGGGAKVEITETAAEDPGDQGRNRRGPN